ncbi:MAG TPA: type III polyketide synthase [Planctomycetota bacterium]|nr:type III polyketide synthase [Planctomycetota bacterium]
MSLAILGLGTAVPERRVSQADALALALELWPYTEEQRRLLPLLYRRAGVQQRHTVLAPPAGGMLRAVAPRDVHEGRAAPGAVPTTAERLAVYAREAGPLACRAAAAALAEAGLEPDRISHLVTVSCTGAAAPGLDVALVRRLELRDDVERTHVGFMGCQGALAGLRVARAFTDADPAARVLLCAAELCSLHFFYGWDSEKIVANALFADGAAALVAGRHGGAGDASLAVTASGSRLLPESEDAMSWAVGDHGFAMTLSARVPALIEEHLPGWLDGWLAAQGLARADVASWAVHPGGPRILGAVEQALELPRAATAAARELLASHGNMSSPTVLFLLQRLRAEGAPRPAVALGFGPGLVAEAALLR